MNENLVNYSLSLIKKIPNLIFSVSLSNNEIVLNVKSNLLYKTLFFLKKHNQCQYKMLTDCTAVDFFENKVRFEVMYSLLSITYNSRLFVKIFVNEMNSVFSVFTLYNCATWLEREIWDMFGIFFKGHPNLCRILTDYGFEGFPLRKDFPMSGYISVRYDDISNSVIYESIELSQDFRFFDFKKSI